MEPAGTQVCGSVPSLPVINPEILKFCLRSPRPPLWSGPSDGCGRIIQVIKAGLFSSNKLLRKRRWSSNLNLEDQDPFQAVESRTEPSFIWSHKCFWKPSQSFHPTGRQETLFPEQTTARPFVTELEPDKQSGVWPGSPRWSRYLWPINEKVIKTNLSDSCLILLAEQTERSLL